MITRRSLFASLAGLAAAPAVAEAHGMTYPEVMRNLGYEAGLEWIRNQHFPPEFKMVVDARGTVEVLLEKARSNLSRSQRDKGQQ